jgi:hypothetical protein
MEPAFSVAVTGGGAKDRSGSLGEADAQIRTCGPNLKIELFAGISDV